MSILIPAVFLASGITVLMVILHRNLKSLDQEAQQAWKNLQAERMAWLDAATRLADSLIVRSEEGCVEGKKILRKVESCRAAETPDEAAKADTVLSAAWAELAARTDPRAMAASNAALDLIEDLRTASDQVALSERIYNNVSVMYNNAGVTFPALLIAKRVGFAAKQQYRPQRANRLNAHASSADKETLAEKSPRIMNAYMLWAVGMSDSTMEKAD